MAPWFLLVLGGTACDEAKEKEPTPDLCEEIGGRKYTSAELRDNRLGDVVLRGCRDFSPGDTPVLIPYDHSRESGSIVLGTKVRWRLGDESSENRGIVFRFDVSPTGDPVRPIELEPGIWAHATASSGWAAITGETLDLDGDGFDDLMVAESADDYHFLSGGLMAPSVEPSFTRLPFQVLDIGDTDGDGIRDIARFLPSVDPDTGREITMLAVQTLPWDGPLDEAPWEVVLDAPIFQGDYRRQPWDAVVHKGFDHNGDGLTDLVAGDDPYGAEYGSVRVYDGPLLESRGADEADAFLRVDFEPRRDMEERMKYRDSVGEFLRSAGDLDNDGYDDLIVVSELSGDGDTYKAGKVWLLHGPLGGVQLLDDSAHATIVADERSTYLANEVFAGGDLNADGWLDLMVAQSARNEIDGEWTPSEHGLRLLWGPLEGTVNWKEGVTLDPSPWDPAYDVAFDQDVDGDGIHDAVMMAHGGSGSASIHIWFSTLSMEWPRPEP